MWYKYLIIFLLFWLFAIIQSSFLPYFNISPNLVFVLFFLLVFFEIKGEYNLGIWISLMAVFFLDALSVSYFGISIVSLIAVYFLDKAISHFLKDAEGKQPIFYFLPIFLACFLAFELLLYLLSFLFKYQASFELNSITIINIIFNLIFAIAGFYIYKIFIKGRRSEKQLKLFR